MGKFRSLLFRELRICRRQNILKLAIILVMSVFYIVGVYIVKNDAESDEIMVLSMVSTLSVTLGFISVMLSLLNYDILKSDLNTNWLSYSYTLPIELKDRALVNVVIRCCSAFVFIALGLVFTGIYCAMGEVSFSASLVVMYFVIFACAMLYTIIYDAVLYRARSLAQLQKYSQCMGFGVVGAIIIAVIIFSDKVKQFMFSEGGIPVYKLMAKLNGRMLIWLIPLCAVLIAADYFVIKNRMRYAYSAVNDNEKAQKEKEVISDTHDYPTGFLYKELKQNRLVIVLIALAPIILLIFNYMMLYFSTMTSENKLTFSEALADGEINILRYLCIALGAYCASGMMSSIFGGDDRKLWAYFTVSTPQGVRGSLYYKYVLAFAMNGIFLVGSVFAASIYDTVYYAATGKENGNLSSIFMLILGLKK